ncbi:MAG TPA: DCC1-like thiol-disulfide oxidoreductase family protein, partial [Chryseosolibacter sp.]|nr:DCC1-like thiol-disulfide oxidoreductase family protein [Chryseosolibacter sp.]
MKTLRNHTIIYDDECPLCDAYTTVFIRTKMLDDNGRTPFSNYNFAACPNLDEVRACNEIALVDNSTGEITYGVNSLVKILSARFPFINRIMEFPLSQWIATRLYRFVSYNRKVIVPGAKTTSVCTPSFNTKYRISYILFACVLSALVLHLY